MKKEQLILDTSLFVNPAAAHVFGRTPTHALTKFLELAEETDKIEFLMPPSIYKELMHFAEEKKVPKKLLLNLIKQPPKKHEVKIPSIFLYDLVENVRDRFDRGLRLAERHVREALGVSAPPKSSKSQNNHVRPDAEVISRLRESYRRIMREGMLDSKADADLLILAYETKGTLVSVDQGVLDWAENLGIKTLSHEHLAEFMQQHSSLKTK